MLINDFFKVIETTVIENKILSKIELNPAHKIYAGHFPNNPITPGVVQVQIVKELLENIYKKELKMVSMSRCKFLKILNPNETPVITVDISYSEDPLHVSATGTHQDSTYFKFTALFSDESIAN
jgi:3-hydroxyacyl-[acyl-carrier-protein] dehydratase